ncbi:MAG: HAMP domain-containing sensor histidine kinase [Pirellulaceae bacterium]
MAYRSLKRVLGETSLERKCRLLFGFCLAVLIAGAFWGVDRVAEDLVMTNTRGKGRDLVDLIMLKTHFKAWETFQEHDELVKDVLAEFEKHQVYNRHEILGLQGEPKPTWVKVKTATDPEEIAILKGLKKIQRQQLDRQAEAKSVAASLPAETEARSRTQASTQPLDGNALTGAIDQLTAVQDNLPVRAERRIQTDRAGKEYHYFEPVYWGTNCRACHLDTVGVGAEAASGGNLLDGAEDPFVVVKVVFPYGETQAAINRARAILIAVAIFTVFVAMIALYVIVRYVIVRPLKHLREVSDSIIQGDSEQRANIRTNDEFEDLAESFNRMLRHLTEAQSELRDVNTDLDNKVDELAQLNMRLYEMNRLKGDFLANMSHELRTPLNSIIGFSEVLQGIGALDDKQRRYAGNIRKSGRLLLEMINDILDLAKMEAGKMDVRPTEFMLETVVQAQCDMMRSLTEEKNIDLEVQVAGNEIPLYQDQAKVQQILMNLLSNAVKFTPEGGRITVAAHRDSEDQLEMTVTDTGVGIAEEDREVIFEKFRQGTAALGGDNLTREYSGTGLGLSILKELCKLMEGEISFESKLGIGSTFRVVLPWVAEDRPQQDGRLTAKLDDLTKLQQRDLITQARMTSDSPPATEMPSP